MTSPAVDIANWLVDQSIVEEFGGNEDWSVHVGRMPTKPEKVVLLYDTGGAEPQFPNYGPLDQPSFQIDVRSPSYEDAFGKINEIRVFLFNSIEFSTDEYRYFCAIPISGIMDLGRTEKDCSRLTANFRIYRHAV